jgi:hypothetical protein
VSVAAPPPPPSATSSAGGTGATGDAPAGDSCPLCGAPLDRDQDWCLRCGAAARTRLAASSSWKAPLIAAVVVAVLALAVLAAALVKLVSDANSQARNTVVLIRTPAPVTPTTPAPVTPTTPAPGTTAPSPGAATPAPATPPKGATAARSTPPGQPTAPASPTTARARLSAPAKRRLAELEADVRASKFPAERDQLRQAEQSLLAGR